MHQINPKPIFLFAFDLFLFISLVPTLLVWLCLYVYKSIVTVIAKWNDPSLLPLENYVDNLLSLEPLNSGKNVIGNLGWIIHVDGKIEINWLRDKFHSLFLKDNSGNYDKFFTSVVEYGGYTFQKVLSKSIDLKLQIKEGELPENISLNEFISYWFCKPFEENLPLWEVMLLPSPTTEGNTIIVYKFHHILGDGYTMLSWLDVLTNTKTPYIVKDFKESTLHKLSLLIKSPRIILNYAWDFLQDTKQIPLPLNLMENCNTPPFYTTLTFELESLKNIRRKTGVHFQSIVLSLLGGLVRRIASENNTSKKEIQDYSYIVSSLPWPNHPKPKMANHWTIGNFKVPLKKMSALKRLKETDKMYRHFHDSEIHKILYRFIGPALSLLPTKIVRRLYASYPGQQLTSTSLLGSSEKLYLNSYPISAVHPIIGKLYNSVGLVTFNFSYAGTLTCTLIGTKDVVKSQNRMDEIIRKYYMEEYQELITTVQGLGSLTNV